MKTIGQRVKFRREQLGMSQAALAEKISATSRVKCSQQAIQQLESDNTKSPRYLLRLAAILDVSPLWLTDGIENNLLDESEAKTGSFDHKHSYNTHSGGEWFQSDKDHVMQKEEGELLSIYRNLSPEGRRSLVEKAKVISFDEGANVPFPDRRAK